MKEAIEIIMKELDEIYKGIEMSRTHAENFRKKASEYEDGIQVLEIRKQSLVAALERLK